MGEEAIGPGGAGYRRKPAITDCELAGQRVDGRESTRRVSTHDDVDVVVGRVAVGSPCGALVEAVHRRGPTDGGRRGAEDVLGDIGELVRRVEGERLFPVGAIRDADARRHRARRVDRIRFLAESPSMRGFSRLIQPRM